MKKRIVYLYGGPGTGKSTTAAELFAKAKKAGVNAELVREYIKDWVWEGREVKPGDQVYIAAKQSRKERVCFRDVDLIISDSPMYLAQFYEEKYDDTHHVCRHIIEKHVEVAEQHGFEFVHVLLKRTKAYNPAGRFQTEEEAIEIDEEIEHMLLNDDIDFYEMDTEGAAENILSLLL